MNLLPLVTVELPTLDGKRFPVLVTFGWGLLCEADLSPVDFDINL